MDVNAWSVTNPDLGKTRKTFWDNDVVITLTGVVTHMAVGGIGVYGSGNGICLADLQASVQMIGNKIYCPPRLF